MEKSFIIFFVIPGLFLFKFAHASNELCHRDEDCLERQFCMANVCQDCINCAIINRVNNSTCGRTLNDCGHCLHGYEEPPVTLGVMKRLQQKPCLKVPNLNLKETICSEDNDCPNSYYCYNKTYCSRCLDCGQMYMRLAPVNTNCARVVDDCGICLNGFREVAVTTAVHRKPCEKIFTSLAIHSAQNTEIYLNNGDIVLLCTGIFLLIVLVVGFYLCYNFLRKQKDNSNLNDGAASSREQLPQMQPPPPPYEIATAQRDSSVSISGFFKETPGEESNARGFQLPDYVNYYSFGNESFTGEGSQSQRRDGNELCLCPACSRSSSTANSLSVTEDRPSAQNGTFRATNDNTERRSDCREILLPENGNRV